MAVEIKSPKEIELMRTVCRLAAETLLEVGDKLRPGMTTADIDKIVHDHTLSQGARPAPLPKVRQTRHPPLLPMPSFQFQTVSDIQKPCGPLVVRVVPPTCVT